MTSKSNTERLAVLETEVKSVSEKLDRHMEASASNHADLVKRLDNLDTRYVTKDRFDPVQKVVYGLVGVVLSGVAVAVIALVIEKK